MSRFPQIPETRIESRPGGAVGPQEPLNLDSGEKAIKTGAEAVDAYATLQQQQKTLDDTNAARDKIYNTTTSTSMALDYKEKLGNLASQIQQQNIDTPEKAAPAFLEQSRLLADSTIHNPNINSDISLSLAKATAGHINEGMTDMHRWEEGRKTQIAKNQLEKMVNVTTRGAEDRISPESLTVYMKAQHASLDPVIDKLHENPESMKSQVDHDMVKSWVVANGARDPIHTLQALDAEKGPLVDNLKAGERQTLRKEVMQSFEGMGKAKHAQVLKEGIDQTGQAYDLFRTGELTSGSVYSMQRSLEQKKMAVSLDPNMSDESRKSQLASIDTQSKTLQLLDEANRKQVGYDAKDDEGTRSKLFQAADKIFPKAGGSTSEDLGAILQFRHDLALAYNSNKIKKPTFDALEKNVALALPKALTKEASNTWHVGFHMRAPREAGNAALNEYFDKGLFSGLSEQQQNDARVWYLKQFNEAMEGGQNVTAESAQQMARKAAYFVAGKKLPNG
jgi:hypothetical protein